MRCYKGTNQDPEISIIVPVYNSEKHLECCIESILGQTFSNFELILIDDGSTDGSAKICDSYARNYNCIKVIHQKNQGQSVARNQGVEYANGKWIHFVDSDDYIHSQMIEILYEAIKKTDARISMCGAEEGLEPTEEFFSSKRKHWEKHNVNQEYLKDLYTNGEHRYWVIWAKLIDKEILRKFPFEEGKIYEDNAIVFKWLCEAKIIVDVSEKLYFYRINPLGTTKSGFSIKRLDYLWALEEQIVFYREKNFHEMLREICMQYIDMSLRFLEILEKNQIDIKGRKRLKRNLLHVIFQNKEQIIITRNIRKRIIQVFHPRLMRRYWYLVAVNNEFKQHGFQGVISKVRQFYRKGREQ